MLHNQGIQKYKKIVSLYNSSCKFKPKSISFLKAFSKQGTQVCGAWNAGIVMMSVVSLVQVPILSHS